MSWVKAKNKSKEKGNWIMNMNTILQGYVEHIKLVWFDNQSGFHVYNNIELVSKKVVHFVCMLDTTL